jgi:hypothetical protein
MRRQDAHRAPRVLGDDAIITSASMRPGLPSLSQLALRTIGLPPSDEGIDLGPITLGERLGGDGHYGFVYAIVGRPDLALKLIHRERSGFRSVARQVAGYRLIEPFPAEIPTVKIIASHCGNNEEACYLVVENFHDGRWADRGVVVAPSVLSERERAAARRLCDNLAARNIVALDCHGENLFFFDGSAGDLTAGILDHDYIFSLEEIPRLRRRTVKRLFTLAGPTGPARSAVDRAVKGRRVSAQELMDAFFQHKIIDDVRWFPGRAIGIVFNDYLNDFDFWGHCDVDIIWGDIRKYTTEKILHKYDIFSTRKGTISGHFSLFRNTLSINQLCRQSSEFAEVMRQVRLNVVLLMRKAIARLARAGSIRVYWPNTESLKL